MAFLSLIIVAIILRATQISGIPTHVPAVIETSGPACSNLEPNKADVYVALRNNIAAVLDEQYGPAANCRGPHWTKVIAVNMSDHSSVCPTGFTLHTSPVRSCGRNGDVGITTASLVVGQSYSEICGRITAIQKGSTNGFGPNFRDSYPKVYVDGIIISHGSSYLQSHIWTFAATTREQPSVMKYGCPCQYDQWHYQLPLHVGSDYFCESGNHGKVSNTIVFLDDPLWDGKGCSNNNACCQFNQPPWFYKKLPQSTADYINITISLNGSPESEDLYITEMELYVAF